jgi:hypothetical protein
MLYSKRGIQKQIKSTEAAWCKASRDVREPYNSGALVPYYTLKMKKTLVNNVSDLIGFPDPQFTSMLIQIGIQALPSHRK